MPRVRLDAPPSAAFWAAVLTLNASYSSGQELEDQPCAKDLRWTSLDQLGCLFQVVPEEIAPVVQSWNSRSVQDQEWLLSTLKVALVMAAPLRAASYFIRQKE